MKRCLSKLRFSCCGCSLKTFGFLYGWMGVIYRTVATIFLAIILTRITEYDPVVYGIALGTMLGYIQVSLVTNLFFLIGIQKEKPYFLLPYTVIGGMELFFTLGIFIFLAVILNRSTLRTLLWSFFPSVLITIGIYMYFWIKSIQLYRQMEEEVSRKREENATIESIRQSLAH